MTKLDFDGANLLIKVEGADKFWALKSELSIPLEHITDVSYDPALAKGWWHGIKAPGTNIPGVVTAGTFYQDGQRVFWDVHNTDNTIVIALAGEHYNRLIIEVDDPTAAVARINALIA